MRRNMYVDENKERGYLIMGAVIDSAHVPHVRRTLRSLLLPGQERLHMTAERDSRRLQIIESVLSLGVLGIAAEALGPRNERVQRSACLGSILSRTAELEVGSVCIERDDAAQVRDRRLLRSFAEELPVGWRLSYSWLPARSEPALWTADALVWAYARGGKWRSLVAGSVAVEVVDV